MRRLIVLLAAAVLLVGCGDDQPATDADGGELNEADVEAIQDAIADAPPCEDLFADGRPVDEILEHLDTSGVCVEDGEPIVVGLAYIDCDTRDADLYYGDRGWGITGDRWHAEPDPEITIDMC